MKPPLSPAWVVAAWGAAWFLHPWPVATRGVDALSAPAALTAAAGDRDIASTVLWASVSLHRATSAPPDLDAIADGAVAAHTLDPNFAAPLAYGARMLHTGGAQDASLQLLERGAEAFPDDPWFPWLIGMQRWERGDPADVAAAWLLRAAELDPERAELHERAAAAIQEGE